MDKHWVAGMVGEGERETDRQGIGAGTWEGHSCQSTAACPWALISGGGVASGDRGAGKPLWTDTQGSQELHRGGVGRLARRA